VSARLTHEPPPADAVGVGWTPRFTDFDVLGHVNNAVYWAMVEEFLDVHAPATIEVEYRGGIDRDQRVEVIVASDALWMTADGAVAATARVTPFERAEPSPEAQW